MITTERLDVELKTTEAACVAYLPMTGAYTQIPAAFGRLYGWIAARRLTPGGAPTGVYLTDPATWAEPPRWELQAPLAADHADAPVDASGCGIKHVAPRLVAAATFRGPYDAVAPAYRAVAEWIGANGYAVAGPPEERYWSEPMTPPEDTVTEIRFPVTKAA